MFAMSMEDHSRKWRTITARPCICPNQLAGANYADTDITKTAMQRVIAALLVEVQMPPTRQNQRQCIMLDKMLCFSSKVKELQTAVTDPRDLLELSRKPLDKAPIYSQSWAILGVVFIRTQELVAVQISLPVSTRNGPELPYKRALDTCGVIIRVCLICTLHGAVESH